MTMSLAVARGMALKAKGYRTGPFQTEIVNVPLQRALPAAVLPAWRL
ncbi:hypothetical protein [Sphingomonas sp. Leaf67]|nr:hypothetical protein [Sphingomonas sp. Leaf67]